MDVSCLAIVPWLLYIAWVRRFFRVPAARPAAPAAPSFPSGSP
jgi:hypothetical protein